MVMDEVDRDAFDDADNDRMRERLRQCVAALDTLLRRPGWGTGPATVGAELELFLIDGDGHPLARNAEVRDRTDDPRVTLEVARFNVEGNLTPVALAGRPLSALRAEMDEIMAAVTRAAGELGGGAIAIGTLPTLAPDELGDAAVTDAPRYKALDHRLGILRRQPYRIDIAGEDHLVAEADDVSLEGANTSFQVHLRVDPERFVETYNAAQIATAPVLAVAGNSPFFLAHRLWDETRIALFKQSVDHRDDLARRTTRSRVSFGSRWLERSAIEIFADAVQAHEPLLTAVSDEDPRTAVNVGAVPGLSELRTHLSSVWTWNRAVYDPLDGGHLRVELRALPAGPTAIDMAANAAFLLGLTLAITEDVGPWTRMMAFEQARENFYRAAESGLDAVLLSPFSRAGLEPAPARELALRLLEPARASLLEAGVEPDDVTALFAVLEGRITSGRTGARWQRATVAALEPRLGRDRALAAMTRRYVDAAASREPVHTWPLPS
jgi:gamma-glutamyl:cysteine ligase YbdK (ATP-grasp superfamily)